jgi:small GTP-binding protein
MINEKITTPLYKILIVGEANVGKTAIKLRFTEDQFILDYHATYGIDYKIKSLSINNDQPVKLSIWDTAGQERYRAIAKSYLNNSHGILICFDITSRDSFFQIGEYWAELVYNHFSGIIKKQPLKENINKTTTQEANFISSPRNRINSRPTSPKQMFVNSISINGPEINADLPNLRSCKCKIALVACKLDKKRDREVTYEEGRGLADALGIDYYETSAMKNLNIEEMFIEITNDIFDMDMDGKFTEDNAKLGKSKIKISDKEKSKSTCC